MKRMKQGLVVAGILALIIVAAPAIYAQEQEEVQQAAEQEQEEQEQEVQQQKAKVRESRIIEATPEQKSRVRNCIVTAARVRKLCGAVERMVFVKQIPQEGFTDRVDAAMQETYLLQDHHEKFMSSLSKDQEKRLKGRVEQLETINERISTSLENLEEELAKEKYQRTDVASITEDIEIDSDDLWRIYKGIAVDMGIKLTAR
jgi:protein involved in sex pheromone biosynthesis